MTLDTVLMLCEKYTHMGHAVQCQLRDVVAGGDPASKNQNAMKMVDAFLRSCERAGVDGAEEVRDEIREALNK
jgi:hypothetical protein